MSVNAVYQLCESVIFRAEQVLHATEAACLADSRRNLTAPIWEFDVREGGTQVLCDVVLPHCERWTDATARLVGNTFPSAEAGAELYAGGFALVMGPAILAWVGVQIVRAIRVATGEK